MTKISIIGRGINPERHLSLYAIRTLKRADKIVGIEPQLEFWKSIQEEFGIQEIEEVAHLYGNQDKDVTNYHRFVQYVLSLSNEFEHIALLVAGHPCLGVSFIELLKKEAGEELEIEIVEGISSFDVMIKHLGIDPLEQGTALLDINRLLLFQYSIEPALSYFLYHASSVANQKTNFLDPSSENRIDLLKNYLLKFYSGEKKMLLCRMATGANQEPSIIETTVAELDTRVSSIDFATTLYLPPEIPRGIDWGYLDLLRRHNKAI